MGYGKKFLNLGEVAERYGLSKINVQFKAKNGILPHGVKIGKSRRWSIEELDAFDAQLQRA